MKKKVWSILLLVSIFLSSLTPIIVYAESYGDPNDGIILDDPLPENAQEDEDSVNDFKGIESFNLHMVALNDLHDIKNLSLDLVEYDPESNWDYKYFNYGGHGYKYYDIKEVDPDIKSFGITKFNELNLEDEEAEMMEINNTYEDSIYWGISLQYLFIGNEDILENIGLYLETGELNNIKLIKKSEMNSYEITNYLDYINDEYNQMVALYFDDEIEYFNYHLILDKDLEELDASTRLECISNIDRLKIFNESLILPYGSESLGYFKYSIKNDLTGLHSFGISEGRNFFESYNCYIEDNGNPDKVGLEEDLNDSAITKDLKDIFIGDENILENIKKYYSGEDMDELENFDVLDKENNIVLKDEDMDIDTQYVYEKIYIGDNMDHVVLVYGDERLLGEEPDSDPEVIPEGDSENNSDIKPEDKPKDEPETKPENRPTPRPEPKPEYDFDRDLSDNKPSRPASGGGSGSSPIRKDKDKDIEEKQKDLVINKAGLDKSLNKDEHFSYIEGYRDGSIRPENPITREEAAAIIFRVLDKDYRDGIISEINFFEDTDEESWSNRYISTLLRGGILNGYTDGSFRPKNNITRAELATIVSRFDDLDYSINDKFADVKGHWAEIYINSAVGKGWIKGYKDGSFRPDEFITRAELVTMINRMLGRETKAENMLEGRKEFNDLDPSKWYYEALEEAANSHEYKLVDGKEVWTKLID